MVSHRSREKSRSSGRRKLGAKEPRDWSSFARSQKLADERFDVGKERLVAQSREVAWRHDQDAALAEEFKLERHHVGWLRSLDRFHRNRVIECNKSPAVPNRKCKQVEIGQLARSVN